MKTIPLVHIRFREFVERGVGKCKLFKTVFIGPLIFTYMDTCEVEMFASDVPL